MSLGINREVWGLGLLCLGVGCICSDSVREGRVSNTPYRLKRPRADRPARRRRPHGRLVHKFVGFALVLATGGNLSAGLRTPALVVPTAPAGWTSIDSPIATDAPPTIGFSSERNPVASPLAHEFQVDSVSATGDVAFPAAPPTSARPMADDGSGPALIPALPAWVIGGVSMLVYAPLMRSRRLRRRLLR